MNDDAELLRQYAEEGANEAFSELVRRHVDLVYSAALRQLNGDAHLAADATQLVFSDLARKAGALARHRVLAGWLFTSTRFVTAKLVRGERRRQAREMEALRMSEIDHDDPAAQLDWQRVRPVLDDVMAELGDADREAILLRFFQGRDYAGVGAKLNLSDNTARMRVERALDKLRALLARRGVRSTSSALAVALANQAVMAAPAGLAATVAGAAVAGGTAAVVGVGAGTAVTFMSITKLQIGLAGAVAVAGATGFVVQAETAAALQDEAARLRNEGDAIATLRVENQRLAAVAAEIAALRQDGATWAQLQGEVATLKAQVQAAAVPARAAATSVASPAAPLVGPIYDISKLTQTPKAKFQARPNYPAELRSTGTGGQVVVDFVVDDQGNVRNAFALRSSQREFEGSAVEAVSQWKFAPGEISGSAVHTHMQIPIVFTVKAPEDRSNPAPNAATFWF